MRNSILAGLVWIVCAIGAPGALAQVCAAPGAGGALTVAAANTTVNTYYPGTAAGGSGSSVGYTSGSARGAATAIAAGDLVFIVQMQDGTGSTTANNNTYAFPATAAGRYEFARVLSVGVNTLNLTSALTNSYTQNTAAANNQTYQVIRVPQYSTLTVNAGASIVPMQWDGTTGGAVVVDVAGIFTNNGSVNASYAGFRGNAGLTLAGQAGAAALTVATMDFVRPDAYLAHGGKGEGIGGSPNRVLNVFASPGVLLTSGTSSANGSLTNATTAAATISSTAAYLNTTARSYNAGSRAAGAPANAGGGGDDSAPANNGENSGGGGGANNGAGGVGGNTWNTNLAIGGRGGNTAVPSLTARFVMGGGGGSGTSNDNYNLDTSGGAGGGVIFVKAGSMAGTGSLLANGQAGRSIPVSGARCPVNTVNNCDGGGGGGAGGTIAILASGGTVAAAQVQGGQGGNINGQNHGPGGGGGGGLVVRSSVVALTASNLAGGVAGLTNVGGVSAAYGAGAGGVGASTTIVNTALPATAGGLPANCLPALTVSKVTSTPASVTSLSPPITTTYSIVVANPAGEGDALGVTLYDPTLPGGSVTVVNPPVPLYSFSASPSACGLGTRTAAVDPANGATSTWTAGAWSLPGGCTLTYTFTVNIPVTVPNGTYNNSAVAWFRDASDSSGTRTVTAALPPAAAGLTANTSFTTGGAVTGSNFDGNNAGNTAEDLSVQRRAGITVAKSNGVGTVTSGTTTTYTVTVANLGPADSSGTLLTDPIATGLTCTAASCASASGGAVCPTPASTTVALLQGAGVILPTFPGNSTLTFSVTCSVN
ncbi:MAG: hypothetical protein ABI907_01325 [Ramlibacter sp.]